MNTYQVELKRVSYVTVTVEAQNESDAEDAAWLELQMVGYDDTNADWSLSEITKD